MEITILSIAIATFLVAMLAFLASVTDLFKKLIPVEIGLYSDQKLMEELALSSGDSAKPLILQLKNNSKLTLTGVVLELKLMRPLSLSGTETALTSIPGKTVHGRFNEAGYYLIRYSDLELRGQELIDFKIELNTNEKNPDTYFIRSTVFSTQKEYKIKEVELRVKIS